MKRMTETQRAQQIEMIIRDSFRQQQQSIRDWIQLLSALGLERDEIVDMLNNYSSMLNYVHDEIKAGRPIR